MSNLIETVLVNEHRALNARLVDFAGFLMPVQYSSAKDESEAVRKSAGMFDVSHMGEFWVTGPEATQFVDYIITNDFKNLPNSKAIYSPLCNHEGKILDDLIAYKFSETEVLVCVNASNIKKDWNWINQFKDKFNISLTNVSDETSLIALQGPKSEEILNKVLNTNLTEMAYYSIKKVQAHSSEFLIARTGYTGEDGFEIFCKNKDVTKLWKDLLASGVVPCGLASRDVLRLEVCYPLYGNDLSEDLSPLDTGLKWTVKMDKADFVGKSALTNYSPKAKLLKFSMDKGIPRQGYEIMDESGKIVGRTTSGTHSVAISKGIGMALVDADTNTKSSLFINIRNQKHPIVLQNKSFVTGGHK